MDKEIQDKIENRIVDIFGFFDVTPTIATTMQDGVFIVEVATPIDDLFTGKTVDPLLALQHLLRVISKTDFKGSEVKLSLNMGGFKEHQSERLTQIAKDAAHQVRTTQTTVYLPAMSSYERRLVHLALSEELDIETSSEGVGAERRVIVRPKV